MTMDTELLKQCIENKFKASDHRSPYCTSDHIAITVHYLTTQYQDSVYVLCPKVSDGKESAQAVVNEFLSKWHSTRLVPSNSHLVPHYVNLQANRILRELQSIFVKHTLITQEVMKLLNPTSKTPPDLDQSLLQLFSLSYWLVLYYNQVKENSTEAESYNLYLHYFLSDFAVVFIMLLNESFHGKLNPDITRATVAIPYIKQCYTSLTLKNQNASQCSLNENKIIRYIKHRLEAFIYKLFGISDAHINTVITVYLLNASYKCLVASCTGLPNKAIELKRLQDKDAEKVAEEFTSIWKANLKTLTLPSYVKIQQKYGNTLDSHTQTHDTIIMQLQNLLYQDSSIQLLLPLVQLLSLAYWLLLYYNKLTETKKNKKKYNPHLCSFLNDLIATFILLLSGSLPLQNCFNPRETLPTNTDTADRNKTLNYIQQSVRQRLEAFDHTPHECSDARIVSVITVHLFKNTFFVPTNPPIQLKDGLTSLNAKEVAQTFQTIWEEKLEIEEEPYYIRIETDPKIFKKRLQLYTDRHYIIIEQLMGLLKDKENLPLHLYEPLVQLLSLACWLLLYCHKIKNLNNEQKEHIYNEHLHYFLSDFFITLLLLIGELCPHNYFFGSPDLCDLPDIMETTFRIKDFAKNPIFRELVLLELCEILGITRANVNKAESSACNRVDELAVLVHQYLIDNCKIKKANIRTKGTKYLIEVITDQARYMKLDKRKNTVAHEKTLNAENFSDIKMKEILSRQDQNEIRKICEKIMEHWLPAPEKLTELASMPSKQINYFYHMAHNAIIWYIDNDCPPINKGGYLADIDFLEYSRKLAQRVIQRATSLGVVESKELIGKVTITLGEIIGARSWSSLQFHKEGIISGPNHKGHKDLLIHCIAFRVLLMYLLPKNPKRYDVESIAKDLPQYARDNYVFI